MGNPKVSIVIPAYNHEKFVGEAIQSVLDQTFPDFELIIINDGSTDNTEAEILKFRDERIRYYSHENRGLSATLNRGIELARGEYFNFLPSDDAFFPEKLEVQIKVFEECDQLGVVFSYPQLVDADGREIKDDPAALWPIVPYETKEEIFPALFERNFLSAPTALIRMDAFKKVGPFDESLKYAQDYDLWMRILKYYDARLIKQSLVKYRWHGENLTFRPTPETEIERERALLKACMNLSIEEIYPNLLKNYEGKNYFLAYKKMGDFLAKSGIPTLALLSQLYKQTAKSLESFSLNVPEDDADKGNRNVLSRSLKRTGGRIRVLIETLTLDRGGLEKVAYNLAKGLSPDLFEVVVVAVEKGGIAARLCKESGIPVEILQFDKEREYQEILIKYQIDIVISHYSTFGVKLASEKGIPILSVIHNIYSWFPDSILSDFRSADPFVSRYIAVSEEVRQYTHYRFNIPLERIAVIPNGIDLEDYLSRIPSRRIDRSELGLGEDDYVFVNVASIGPPKGQNVILAALKRTVKKYPQIKVLSIGEVFDDGFLDFLKKKIEEFQLSDHFKFIGVVDDVKPYFQISDAFILTSFIEGWPLSVMEAMLQQLPVLVTRVGGVEAILGESGAGIILSNNYEDIRLLDVPSLDSLSREESPRNAQEVAQAMERFYEEKESWKQLGAKGYERIVKHFDLRGMVRSYEREILSLYILTEEAREHRHLTKIQEHDKLFHEILHLYEGKLSVLYTAMEKSTGHRLLERINEEQKRIQKDEETLEGLRSQIAHAQERLESGIGSLESGIGSLESGIGSLEGLRSQILHAQERLESGIGSLESKTDLLDSKINVKWQGIEKQMEYILIRLSLKERFKGVIYRLMKKLHKLLPVAIREKHRKGYRKIFLDKVTPADQRRPLDRGVSTPEVELSGAGVAAGMIHVFERDPIQDFLMFKREIKSGLPLECEKLKVASVPGLVSVALPVYNQAYLLRGSIESVLAQTYPNLELIVVNDGSTDEIEKVLGPYRGHPKVKIVEQENQKLPIALSNGFRLARGEFFTWTSADNFMGKKQLETQVDFLCGHPDVQMVYGNYDIIDDAGNPFLNTDYCPGYQNPPGSNHISLPRDLSELNAIRNNYIGPCFMYRSWVGRLIGDYDATMFTMEDYEYWMTINTFFRIEHIGRDDSLYFNRVHEDSLTGRKKELRIVEKTDRLMEFERTRREFYRKKFNVYLVGNDERLTSVKSLLEANGNFVRQFPIPCGDLQMEKEKALGIWISSSVERGFVARIMRENPHAFFVLIQLDRESSLDHEFLKTFGMRVLISGKGIQSLPKDNWFFAEGFSSALYPILCKSNIELFRRKDRFDRWDL